MGIEKKELDDFRTKVRRWLEDNRPEKPDFLLPQSFMEVGTDEQFHYLRDWQRKVYEAGYLGMSWPREYGGGGMPQIIQDIATEEMKTGKFPFMVNSIGINWAGPLILAMGTEEDKQKYIRGILNAEDIWCQGFSEPDHGSDLGNVQLRAERDGDEYVLNGSKIWTTLGTHGKYMILLARTKWDTNSKYAGLSYFLAPMRIPGIDVFPIRKLTGEYGFCQTFFEDARIPASCLIGGDGNGWTVAIQTLQYERNAEGGSAGGPAGVVPFVH
jgi:alkylation response protein AidB-like acyl-CoA dehydrogenase